MEIGHLIPHIEALIFASDKPLTALELTELINNAFGFMEDKIVLDQVESALEGIVEKYKSEFYPFEVRESGGGWQFLTKRDYHKTVAQLNGDKFLKRLSTAALEALSIIAYKQPVTKAEIEAIRGVSSDYAIQKLLEKELIVITGRNEKMPGHPLVYGTSKNFMDYFGINSAEDLPKLKEVFDEAMVNATNVSDAIAAQTANDAASTTGEENTEEDSSVMVVGENGELIEGGAKATAGHINGEAVEFASAEEGAAEEGEEENTTETDNTEETEEDTTIEDSTELAAEETDTEDSEEAGEENEEDEDAEEDDEEDVDDEDEEGEDDEVDEDEEDDEDGNEDDDDDDFEEDEEDSDDDDEDSDEDEDEDIDEEDDEMDDEEEDEEGDGNDEDAGEEDDDEDEANSKRK